MATEIGEKLGSFPQRDLHITSNRDHTEAEMSSSAKYFLPSLQFLLWFCHCISCVAQEDILRLHKSPQTLFTHFVFSTQRWSVSHYFPHLRRGFLILNPPRPFLLRRIFAFSSEPPSTLASLSTLKMYSFGLWSYFCLDIFCDQSIIKRVWKCYFPPST